MSRTPRTAPVPGVGAGDRENVTRNAPAGARPWCLLVRAMVMGWPPAPVGGPVRALTPRWGWNGGTGMGAARPLLASFSSRIPPLLWATGETSAAPAEALAGTVRIVL